MILCSAGLQPGDDGMGESVLFHGVQSADGEPSGCRHFVYGGLGVQACLLKEGNCSLHRLEDNVLGNIGLEAQLHTAFGCCPQ